MQPVTNLFGFYHQLSGLSCDGFLLTNHKELMFFLQEKKPETLVIKPVSGGRGKKVMVLDKIEYRGDNLNFQLAEGGILTFNELTKKIEEISLKKTYSGCLLEEKILQHEVLGRINPASVNTVRVATFLNKNNKADVHLAVFRLGRVHTSVDNTSRGGLVVGVNVNEGTLGEGVYYTKYGRGRYTEHPDTGFKFAGLKLPYWEEITDLCQNAAEVSPFCRSIGWDVAITPDGPLLLEGNDHWFVNQAHTNGYLQPNVRASLAEFGLVFPEDKLPPIKVRDLCGAIKRWSKL